MYTIAVRLIFDASHEIPGIPGGHQCCGRHVHEFAVDVRLVLTLLPPHESVVEVVSLVPLHRYLQQAWQNQHLNDVLAVIPTLPHLARHLFAWCQTYLGPVAADAVRSVRVSTDPDNWASYTPDEIEHTVRSPR